MAVASELSRHGYNHIIAWLDQNIASMNCCRELKKAFTTTTNPESSLQTSISELDINGFICDNMAQRDTSFLEVPFPFILFDKIGPCLTFLIKNATRKRIFFITSGALGEKIVPLLLGDHRTAFADEEGNIDKISIYVFCANMAYHSKWADEYIELGCLQMSDDDRLILARLTRDIAEYLQAKGNEELSNNELSSVELALQYFGWAKNLYIQADKVRPAYRSNDPKNPINIINLLIDEAEKKRRNLQSQANNSDEQANDSDEQANNSDEQANNSDEQANNSDDDVPIGEQD